MAVQSYSDILASGGGLLGASSGGSGDIPLALTMEPMGSAFPAVDATNGPLTEDTGPTASASMPAPAGKTLYRWNSGVFRTQGMNWVAANTAANTSGQTAAINASTPRKWTYGTSQNQPMESNHDFAFITDSQTVTIVYWHWNGYTSSNYHDIRLFVEHEGTLRHLRDSAGKVMPKTSTAGAGFFYERVTLLEARERQFRCMLPSNCFFIGVYIDALATIRKAPNVFTTVQNGDSWQEPNGNILADPIGGAYPTGTYRTMGLAQEIAVITGWVCALTAEGGTGHFNVNDGTSRADTYTGTAGESTFLGEPRLADAITKFGGGNPLWIDIGGWNDGDLPGTPFATNYQTRVQAGLNRLKSKKSDIKVVGVSIQPVGSATTLDANRAASLQGQKAAYTDVANSANVIGFVDLTSMWLNVSTSGQRGANVNSADTIHLHAKGAELVARWIVASLKQLTIPQSYYNKMITAA